MKFFLSFELVVVVFVGSIEGFGGRGGGVLGLGFEVYVFSDVELEMEDEVLFVFELFVSDCRFILLTFNLILFFVSSLLIVEIVVVLVLFELFVLYNWDGVGFEGILFFGKLFCLLIRFFFFNFDIFLVFLFVFVM